MLTFDATTARRIVLDYGDAAGAEEIVRNLSGVAEANGRLWTVSDEGRSIERLLPEGDGYIFDAQLRLEDLFPALPAGEADLEGLDVDGGLVWASGSHCRVRVRPDGKGRLASRLRSRRSRNLLAAIPADGARRKPFALPFNGSGSLRRALARDPFVGPYLPVPSKENGLDIEGLALLRDRVFLGLRGPVIDSFAVAIELARDRRGRVVVEKRRRHFLDLGGLGVRDLCRDGNGLLVLAGPVTATDGPFRLFRWRPAASDAPQCPELVGGWSAAVGKPEGLCRLERGGESGILVVYDDAAGLRSTASRYEADWFALD